MTLLFLSMILLCSVCSDCWLPIEALSPASAHCLSLGQCHLCQGLMLEPSVSRLPFCVFPSGWSLEQPLGLEQCVPLALVPRATGG